MRASRPRGPPPGSSSWPRLVKQAKAERLAQAGPAVVGGAAANADHDPARSGGDGRQQELAGAARGGDEADCVSRPAPAPAPTPRPSRSRRFDRRRAGRNRRRSARPAGRSPGPRESSRRSPRRGRESSPRRRRPSAPGRSMRRAPPGPPRAHRRRGLEGRQASLEFIRGDHHAHCHCRRPMSGSPTNHAPLGHRGAFLQWIGHLGASLLDPPSPVQPGHFAVLESRGDFQPAAIRRPRP